MHQHVSGQIEVCILQVTGDPPRQLVPLVVPLITLISKYLQYQESASWYRTCDEAVCVSGGLAESKTGQLGLFMNPNPISTIRSLKMTCMHAWSKMQHPSQGQ